MAVKVGSRIHVFQVICYTPYQRSSSIKSCLPLKLVFCQGTSSAKGRRLLKGFFRQRSSSSFGSFSVLGFSPGYGIAQLSFSLFVSSGMNKSTVLLKRLTSKGS